MDQKNKLLESDTSTLALSVGGADISAWDAEKKTAFLGTFADRTNAGRYILEKTALCIAESGLRRKFIGERHFYRLFPTGTPVHYARFGAPERQRPAFIGGREVADLDGIAAKRAQDVLAALPPLNDAVRVIDADLAKKIERIEVLKKQGEQVKEQVEEASEPIVMADIDQKMTIGAFRDLVKAKDKKRRGLLKKLAEIGQEGSELERTVATRLYKGLPGLAEAVVEVVTQHLERSKALDTLNRRVIEQVQFGDNQAALDLLKHFEADEVEVSDNVKKGLVDALTKLKLAVRQGRVTKKTLGAKEQD